jgi:glycosyltransferase involved in cell wall biosynthesis
MESISRLEKAIVFLNSTEVVPNFLKNNGAVVPKVSLLVAMRNESEFIERCLSSIFAQDYPADRLEVLVMDGQSTDGSRQTVAGLCQQHSNFHLLANPKVIQSAAWNEGIINCTGEIIGIVSGHAELAPDYVSKAVETLIRTKADLVGGPTCPYSDRLVGKAIAAAMCTPFGVGGGRFHYSMLEEKVDTVFMGLCWRSVYELIGGFDEEMVRNQDDEFSYRLGKAGGKIICNPSIRSSYCNRSTVGSLWRQYFQYGQWKVRVLQKHPLQMRLRQFVPGLFIACLVLSTFLSVIFPFGYLLLVASFGSYIICNLLASIHTSSQRGWNYSLILPIVYATLHLSYGCGFLAGLVKFSNKWGCSQSQVPLLKHIVQASSHAYPNVCLDQDVVPSYDFVNDD